jgi:hypothetical protein
LGLAEWPGWVGTGLETSAEAEQECGRMQIESQTLFFASPTLLTASSPMPFATATSL